ncbi:MAG: DUF3810 domain-containing protein [Eubacteriales bacterium]
MKTVSRGILIAIFVVLTGLLFAVGQGAPDIFWDYYRQFSQWILGKLSFVTGFFSFALWEWIVLLLLLWMVYTLVQDLRNGHFLSWIAGVGVVLSAGAFCFVAFWGLGHFGPPITDSMDLEVREYTVEELEEAAWYYLERANEVSYNVSRNADGVATYSDFADLAVLARDGFDNLQEAYPFLGTPNATVKKLTAADVFSYAGTTGIFVCLTGESCVNPQTYPVSIPFTMCHELAHRLGVTAEDEANFIGFLASSANPDPEYQYSAYYSAFIYTYNALYKADATKGAALWSAASDGLKADCIAASAHYEPYEGKVQEVTEQVNNTYLQTFNQESGVQSYGEVTDQLIAYFQKNEKI